MTDTELFARTSDAFVATVRGIRPEQWNEPGLGVWDVRSLVGHASRALVTLIDYLALEAPRVATMTDAESYYALAQAEHLDPSGIAQRGVDAGRSLGDDPVATIEALAAHTMERLGAQPEERILQVRGGSILLKEYLRTRMLELVVHTLDIARATGQEAPIPPEATARTLGLAAGIAACTGRAEELLLAVTGRTRLAEGFSVV